MGGALVFQLDTAVEVVVFESGASRWGKKRQWRMET